MNWFLTFFLLLGQVNGDGASVQSERSEEGSQEIIPIDPSRSLITYGDFENTYYQINKIWNIPFSRGNLFVDIDRTTSCVGNASLHFAVSPYSQVQQSIARYLVGWNKLSPYVGKTLTLSACIRTENASYADVYLEGINRAGQVVGSQSLTGGVTGTQGWKTFQVEVQPSPQMVALRVLVGIKGVGKAWFDNIQIAPTSGSDSSVSADDLDSFRKTLSRYVLAQSEADAEAVRKELDTYQGIPINLIPKALEEGLDYSSVTGNEKVEGVVNHISGSWQIDIVPPKEYSSEDQPGLLVFLRGSRANTSLEQMTRRIAKNRDIVLAQVSPPSELLKTKDLSTLSIGVEGLIETVSFVRRNYRIDKDKIFLLAVEGGCPLGSLASFSARNVWAALAMLNPLEGYYVSGAGGVDGLPVYVGSTVLLPSGFSDLVGNWKKLGGNIRFDQYNKRRRLPTANLVTSVFNWITSQRKREIEGKQVLHLYAKNQISKQPVEVLDFGLVPPGDEEYRKVEVVNSGDNFLKIDTKGINIIRLYLDPKTVSFKKEIEVEVGGEVRFKGFPQPDWSQFVEHSRKWVDLSFTPVASVDVNCRAN